MYSFVQGMCILWHLVNPTIIICPSQEGDNFMLWHRGVHGGQFPSISHWERPTSLEGSTPTIEADLVLALLCKLIALFHPTLGQLCSCNFHTKMQRVGMFQVPAGIGAGAQTPAPQRPCREDT